MSCISALSTELILCLTVIALLLCLLLYVRVNFFALLVVYWQLKAMMQKHQSLREKQMKQEKVTYTVHAFCNLQSTTAVNTSVAWLQLSVYAQVLLSSCCSASRCVSASSSVDNACADRRLSC
jgi:hypothetical protein